MYCIKLCEHSPVLNNHSLEDLKERSLKTRRMAVFFRFKVANGRQLCPTEIDPIVLF